MKYVVLILLFLGGIVGVQGSVFRYFENDEAFQDAYREVLHQYETVEDVYQKAKQDFANVCGDKLRLRCEYIQDKMIDFEELDINGSLFCKQSVCYNIFGSHFEHQDQVFELHSCQNQDHSLDLCDRGSNHRYQTFKRMGMVPSRTYLVPPKASFYKVHRMIEAQNIAYDAGLSKQEAFEVVYQLNLENGEWNELVMGDEWCLSEKGHEDYCFRMERYGMAIKERLHHCSLGLVQFNACAHYGVSAEDFIANVRNREWKDYRFQIKKLVDFLVEKKEEYQDFERAQVHWNYPEASRNGYHTTVPYFEKLERVREKFKNSDNVLGAVEVTLDDMLHNITHIEVFSEEGVD